MIFFSLPGLTDTITSNYFVRDYECCLPTTETPAINKVIHFWCLSNPEHCHADQSRPVSTWLERSGWNTVALMRALKL